MTGSHSGCNKLTNRAQRNVDYVDFRNKFVVMVVDDISPILRGYHSLRSSRVIITFLRKISQHPITRTHVVGACAFSVGSVTKETVVELPGGVSANLL